MDDVLSTHCEFSDTAQLVEILADSTEAHTHAALGEQDLADLNKATALLRKVAGLFAAVAARNQ